MDKFKYYIECRTWHSRQAYCNGDSPVLFDNWEAACDFIAKYITDKTYNKTCYKVKELTKDMKIYIDKHYN